MICFNHIKKKAVIEALLPFKNKSSAPSHAGCRRIVADTA
jgi:hypothetical protein